MCGQCLCDKLQQILFADFRPTINAITVSAGDCHQNCSVISFEVRLSHVASMLVVTFCVAAACRGQLPCSVIIMLLHSYEYITCY